MATEQFDKALERAEDFHELWRDLLEATVDKFVSEYEWADDEEREMFVKEFHRVEDVSNISNQR